MRMTQLILQHSQQIPDNTNPLLHQLDPLIHLEIGPDSLVDGFELGFGPHQFRGVEDGALEVDVDAEDEELADLHVDFAAGEVDAAGGGDGRGDGLRGGDGGGEEVFVEGCLGVEGKGLVFLFFSLLFSFSFLFLFFPRTSWTGR